MACEKPEEQEVFLSDAERIRIITNCLDELVKLYDQEDLGANKRHAKYLLKIGEIMVHLTANPNLFEGIEQIFLSALQVEDNTLLNISFHSAALRGILEERSRDNEVWEESFYKGKLKLLENIDQAIEDYKENPFFTNLMVIIDVVSGYHFIRSNSIVETDEQLLLLTKLIYNKTAKLCVYESRNSIIEFLTKIQAQIAPDIERLKSLFRL